MYVHKLSDSILPTRLLQTKPNFSSFPLSQPGLAKKGKQLQAHKANPLSSDQPRKTEASAKDTHTHRGLHL